MPKMHYREVDKTLYPVCGVYDGNLITTENLDLVTCRRCLKWEAHVRQDPSIITRLLPKN